MTTTQHEMRLYAPSGHRLYLTEAERARFLTALAQATPAVQTLGLTLFHTGCRLSEALALSVDDVWVAERVVVFRTLKRRKLVVREVPVPAELLNQLTRVHGLERAGSTKALWDWHRVTAWRVIKLVMTDAGIVGLQACPKGLRHGFGVHAIRCGIQLNILQKWMGHARLTTTAIYANVTGLDEWQLAARMW